MVEEESNRLVLEGDYKKYLQLNAEQKIEKVLEFQELLTQQHQTESRKPSLLLEFAKLLVAAKEYKEAIASYDQALKFKPDYDSAWYNKACSYALQGNIEQAIENLEKAIHLNPDKYQEMAKTDSDFDSLREDERFLVLIQAQQTGN